MNEKKTNKEGIIHFIKFTLFSISAGVIQVVAFAIMSDLLNLMYWPSYLTALTLSVLWNFTLNRKFTFKSAANIPFAMFLVALYYAAFTPLSTWWGHQFVDVMGYPEYLILAGTMIINFSTEFLYTKYVVYHNNINTAVKNQEEIDPLDF